MEAGVALEGQQYLLLALDEGEGDALPLLGVVIPGELLDGLGHVCNRNTQFIPRQAAETALKCALFIPFNLCACFYLFFSREEKAFPRGEATCAVRNGCSSLIS